MLARSRCASTSAFRGLLQQRCLRATAQFTFNPHRRCLSGNSEPPPPEKPAALTPQLVFEGPKASLVRTMKVVSVANLTFAMISSPLLCYVTNLADAPGKGVAMSILLLSFGGGTTAALTWATRTYVKTMHATSRDGNDTLTIVTPTFFGGDRTVEIEWDAVQRCSGYHPFATFQADGRKFYLDEGGELDPDTQRRLEAAMHLF